MGLAEERRERLEKERETRISAMLESMKSRIQIDPDQSVESPPDVICDDCKGLGWLWERFNVPPEHPRYHDKQRVVCQSCEVGRTAIRKQWENMFKEASTPVAYQNYGIDDWLNLDSERSDKKKLAISMAYIFIDRPDHNVSLKSAYKFWKLDTTLKDTTRNWLIFQGDYGVGKTSLALTVSNELNVRGYLCLFLRVADFIESVQRLYDKKVREELGTDPVAIIDQARKAPILVLDDFNVNPVKGSKKASENRRDIMEQVIRWRYNNRMPTVITLNDTQKDFKEAWGERIVSPILDAAHWITMGGKKLRDERPPLEAF
jgi:DNA replication protein DnaC